MSGYSLKARFVFPVDAAPIPEGQLGVSHHRIAHVGPSTNVVSVDLGNMAILPALVNAHTHLEFSHLSGTLGHPGMCFSDWIRAVLNEREEAQQSDPAQTEFKKESVARGLSESLRLGSVTLGEIATAPWDRCMFETQSPGGVVFLELIGLSEARVAELLLSAREHLAVDTRGVEAWCSGLSPHAPYTASRSLIAEVAQLSAKHHASIAMHLAESRQEIELLRESSGPLRRLLEERDLWNPSHFSPSLRPLDYLRTLDRADRVLVVHGNYLDQEELCFLASASTHMSLIYCPRTHAYFRHDPYPLAQALEAGVHVALGTDSLASNPDLSLLEEMRYVRQQHPDVSGDCILRMGTLHGAEALNIADKLGSLTVGKRATWIALELPEGEYNDPHDLLFLNQLPVGLVVVDGKPVYAREKLQDVHQKLLSCLAQ